MSYHCPIHNWVHLFQECPSCCSMQTVTTNTTGPLKTEMSAPKKPLEFWATDGFLYETEQDAKLNSLKNIFKTIYPHKFIEYSEYEKLQKEFLELQKELDLLQEFKTMYGMGYDLKSLDQMRTENSKLKAELEKEKKWAIELFGKNAALKSELEQANLTITEYRLDGTANTLHQENIKLAAKNAELATSKLELINKYQRENNEYKHLLKCIVEADEYGAPNLGEFMEKARQTLEQLKQGQKVKDGDE